MRAAFIQKLIEIADKDPRVLLLTGDLGFMVMEPFAERFPDRFFNVGVAEQNMVGLSTGLAESGLIPFIYSIATFASMRPYEFIRNGPVFHHLPVRIIGVGAGFEYGHNGITHYALEDIALMRVQPGLTTIAPADYQQATAALEATWDLPGPIYFRLGKDEKTCIKGLDGKFQLGHAQTLGQGQRVLLITSGHISHEAISAQNRLEAEGIPTSVMIIASISPPPISDIQAALKKFDAIITFEAHYRNGGIGSLVCEIIAETGFAGAFARIGINDIQPGQTGAQGFMQKTHGLSVEALVQTAHKLLNPESCHE